MPWHKMLTIVDLLVKKHDCKPKQGGEEAKNMEDPVELNLVLYKIVLHN